MCVCVHHTCHNCIGLLKDFWRTTEGLLKDFWLYGLQNLLVYKSQPPGLQDLLFCNESVAVNYLFRFCICSSLFLLKLIPGKHGFLCGILCNFMHFTHFWKLQITNISTIFTSHVACVKLITWKPSALLQTGSYRQERMKKNFWHFPTQPLTHAWSHSRYNTVTQQWWHLINFYRQRPILLQFKQTNMLRRGWHR